MSTRNGRSPKITKLAPCAWNCHRATERGAERQREVRARARERNQQHVASAAPEPGRVHRNGLGPTDHRHVRDRAEHRQDDRTERIHVRDRVEREPARLLRGVVTEQERHDPVTDLVQDDRDDQRRRRR